MEDEKGIDEKILAVPVDELYPFYKQISSYRDLPEILLEQISHFFQHYKDLEKGKWVRVLRWAETGEAPCWHRTCEDRGLSLPAPDPVNESLCQGRVGGREFPVKWRRSCCDSSENLSGWQAHDQILEYDFKAIVCGHVSRYGAREDVLIGRE
jgi:hypothetical protein